MGTQSFPKHLKGRAARPANDAATEGGTQINYATDRAAEVAAELGITAEDLGDLVGTGKEGAITVADVKNWGKEPEEG